MTAMHPQPSYVWLGCFRFTLAFMVFVAHAAELFDPFADTISPGALGVYMFFVISGYIIAGALEQFYTNRPVSFLFNRAIRLFPVYWVCFIVSCLAIIMLDGERLGGVGVAPNIEIIGMQTRQYILGLSILGGYFDAKAFGPNPPAWSVNVEWIYYLIAAFAFLFNPHRHRIVLTISGVLALILMACVWAWDAGFRFYGSFQFTPFFVAGAAHWYVNHREGGKTAQLLLLLALIGSVVFILSTDSYGIKPQIEFSSRRLANLTTFVLLYVIFAGAIRFSFPPGRAMRLDRIIGDLTYPFYLCHVPVLAIMWHHAPQSRGIAHFLLSFVACTAVAFAIGRFVDAPLLKLRTYVRGRSLPHA